MLRKILFCFLFLVTLFASCDEFGNGHENGANSGGTPNVGSPGLPAIKPFVKGDTVSRTLLLYLMAENSISDYLEDDYDEIKCAAYSLPDDARMFVFFDNSDTTRLPSLVQYHPYNGRLVENVVYEFKQDVCSSDTAVLGKVLDVVFANYPTCAFDLVMGSHADGWVRHHAKSAPNRIIGIDNGKNSYRDDITTTIEIEELAALLERMPLKVDRLMFDACLMQGVEVAYALRNAANWIIASPAEIPANGAPYHKVVPEFFNPASGVEGVMREYKADYDNEYYASVFSAVRTEFMQELADVTGIYVEKYFSADTVNNYTSCLAYAPRVAPAYYDVNSVMKKFLDAADYEHWRSVFDKAVPYIMVSDSKSGSSKVWSNKSNSLVYITDDCGAVSAYFPQNKVANKTSHADFRTTEWYNAAGWAGAGW